MQTKYETGFRLEYGRGVSFIIGETIYKVWLRGRGS